MLAFFRKILLVYPPCLALFMWETEAATVWYLIPAVAAVWVLIDAYVVYHCLDIMSYFRPEQDFVDAFFNRGLTWKELREPAHRYERIIRDLEHQAGESWAEQVRPTLRREGFDRALRLVPKQSTRIPFGG